MNGDDMADHPALKVAACIATTGRPQILIEAIHDLMRQTRPADRVVVCPAHAADVEGIAEAHPTVEIVTGDRGLPKQRNALLRAVSDCDVAIFFDDDFIAAPRFIERAVETFASRPAAMLLTGNLLADGIKGPGLTVEEARTLIATDDNGRRLDDRYVPRFAVYGCNMAVRLAPAYRHGLTFDERLPLYGWLEDWDFSGAMAAKEPSGEILCDREMRGVHLGAKSGRTSGLRLGYSQMVNPMYILRKGTLPPKALRGFMVRQFAANIVRSIVSEPYIDRRGRLLGNLVGLRDLLLRRDDPEKILRF